jgi:sRNA-binding protein
MEYGSTSARSAAASPAAARERDDEAPITDKRAARRAGMKDAKNAIPLLQQRWPAAFPKKYAEVRPLALSAAKEIAQAMEWNLFYTLGVLSVWKSRDAYCDAVLRGGERYDLNGKATAQMVDDRSKDQALKRRTARAAKLRKIAAEKLAAGADDIGS